MSQAFSASRPLHMHNQPPCHPLLKGSRQGVPPVLLPPLCLGAALLVRCAMCSGATARARRNSWHGLVHHRSLALLARRGVFAPPPFAENWCFPQTRALQLGELRPRMSALNLSASIGQLGRKDSSGRGAPAGRRASKPCCLGPRRSGEAVALALTAWLAAAAPRTDVGSPPKPHFLYQPQPLPTPHFVLCI